MRNSCSALRTKRIERMTELTFALLSAAVMVAARPLHAQSPAFPIPPAVEALLESHCADCHGEDSQKGDVRVDQLATMPFGERLALLNRMQEQTFLAQMPPKSRKSQPTAAEWKALVEWMAGELRVHNASTLEDKLRLPAYGNYVDHDRLFSGEIKDAPFTPARRWRV